MKKIRIAGIVEESVVDGPGIRYVVFTQGCKHNCPGCHNPETHSFNGGEEKSIEEIISEIKENPLLTGVTFSGGEPFEQAEELAKLAVEIKKLGLDILVYSGYTFEKIMRLSKQRRGWAHLLQLTDILIDGPFIISKRSLDLKFRGSSNQRIIDVQKSLKEGRVVVTEP